VTDKKKRVRFTIPGKDAQTIEPAEKLSDLVTVNSSKAGKEETNVQQGPLSYSQLRNSFLNRYNANSSSNAVQGYLKNRFPTYTTHSNQKTHYTDNDLALLD
jgi:hypothetical protein